MKIERMAAILVKTAIRPIAYRGSICAKIEFTIARIKPPMHPVIRTNPVTTVGAYGKVSSLAKLRPIGTIGTISIPAVKMLT
jgi:hypothetical protein